MIKNKLFCQILADICDTKINVPEYLELTAYGAARLAGQAVGITLPDLGKEDSPGNHYAPGISTETRKEMRTQWKDAIERTKST